jgi:hypothetical protein
MDQDLKIYLEEKFSEVRTEISGVRLELEEKFSEVRAEIEASETRLLTEFWKWGRTADQRMRRVEHSDATTTERLASMEERIFTLERKAAGSKERN